MLKRGCFTKEWIEKIRIENPPADPTIIEKTIYAFELISQLVKHKLDFIFKGGTSLILIFDKPKRLSIDVDITTEAESSKIEKCNATSKTREELGKECREKLSDIFVII